MSEPRISLCMIVKNEERFLETCLRSVQELVDEIVIVDTGSTDLTLDIAKKFGAHIYHFQWCDDFAAARNFSLSQASADWALVMDADEELDHASIPEIRKTLKSSNSSTAYFLKVINYLNENDELSNSTDVSIVRLFPVREDVRYRRAIHEEIFSQREGELTRAICNARIFHRGYTDKLHKERKKGERNVNLLLKCIEKEPDNPFHYYNLGVSYYVQDRLEESIKAFKTSQEKCDYASQSVYLPSCYSLCAAALVRSGNPKEGKEQAEKAIELSPYFYEAFFNLAKAYLGLKQKEDAKVAFKTALECSDKPQLAVMDRGTGGWKACCELGLIYLDEGKSADALKYFNKGLEILPNSSKLLINAAHCYRNLLMFEFACDSFERAHQLEPRRLDIFYDLINLYDKMGFYQASIKLLEEMLDYYPSNKDLFFDTARRYDYMRNYKLAVHYYTQTLILDDRNEYAYFHRARRYWTLGATGKARKDLISVYNLNPDLLEGITLDDFMK